MEFKEVKGMFDGPIIPVALRIALPIMFGNILQLMYMIVDTYFISLIDLSSTALLAGTGLLFPLFFLFIATGASLNIGISSLVGRTIGENNMESARRISGSALAIALALGLPAMIVGLLFGRQLVGVLAGSEMSPAAISYGLDYFYSILPGMVLLIIGQVFMGILQGEGSTRIIAKAMLISTVSNMILDPLFIFGFDLGVTGAGLATTVAHLVALLYLLSYMASGKCSVPVSFNVFHVQWRIVRELFRIGIPQFLNMASFSVGLMFLNKLVGGIGEHFMNAWTIAGRMDHILIIPAISISGATITMISQNYGRGNLDRVRRIYIKNVQLGMAMLLIFATLYILLAPFLFPFFTDVESVLTAAVRQVRYLSHSLVGLTVSIISSAAFQAVGKPLPAVFFPLLRMGVLAVPLAYLMVHVYQTGMNGVFLGLAVGNLAIFPVSFFWARAHLRRLNFKAFI